MRPALKYCGNHSLADVRTTIASKADYIGFIFTKKSRRTVLPGQVAGWLETIGLPAEKKIVGVFADDSAAFIKEVARSVPLDIIQLHGHEQPQELTFLKKVTGRPIWKALHHDDGALKRMAEYQADGYIIDTKVKGALGGTGISFDWSRVPEYTKEAERQNVPCLIAGGVRPDNIQKLLAWDPAGIDMASGIELKLQKDSGLIHQIEEKVRKYEQATAG